MSTLNDNQHYYCEGLDPPPRDDDNDNMERGCNTWHRLRPENPAEVLRMIQQRDHFRQLGTRYHSEQAEIINEFWVRLRGLMTIGECYHGGEPGRHLLQQIYEAMPGSCGH